MAEQHFDQAWIDRYVRDELSEAEAEAFELALLESPDLQDQLEAVLAIRSALEQDASSDSPAEDSVSEMLAGRNHWQPLAMAASVLLAIVSTTLLWKATNDTRELRDQIESLSRPATGVLSVSVDIMRSSGGREPDLILQKPSEETLVMFDIQLSPAAAALERVHFALVDESGESRQAWSAVPGSGGRSSVALRAGALPDGRVWLDMSDGGGNRVDRRLLEFRPKP